MTLTTSPPGVIVETNPSARASRHYVPGDYYPLSRAHFTLLPDSLQLLMQTNPLSFSTQCKHDTLTTVTAWHGEKQNIAAMTSGGKRAEKCEINVIISDRQAE